MRNRWVASAVTLAFALSASATHVTVKAVKEKHAESTTDFIVHNGEYFPVDVCLSDALTGAEKVELSPFTIERYTNGNWTAVAAAGTAFHIVTALDSGSRQTYTVHVQEPGRYRLVLAYGRAQAGDKGCETLFHGLTHVVNSHAFEVR
jgi:hypothetical protein